MREDKLDQITTEDDLIRLLKDGFIAVPCRERFNETARRLHCDTKNDLITLLDDLTTGLEMI